MAGESLRIKGEITANEDLHFEGEIEGTISVPEHTLVVGRTARVHANVEAKAIVVAGSLMGSAVAKERCEVQEAATVAFKLGVHFRVTLDQRIAQNIEDVFAGLHVNSQAALRAVTNAARAATLLKWLRVSLASASILMP